MNENQSRSLILIIVTIATLTIVVGMATYAFFATTRDVNNAINANVQTAASMYSFSASSNGNIEMNIAFNEMSEAGVSTNVLKTDNATIDVSLASPTDGMITMCTYDIVWVWDSEDKYVAPDMTLPYCDGIIGSWCVEGYCHDMCEGKYYNYEFSAKVDPNSEKDLSKYPISENIVTLQKEVTIESNSTIPTTKTHTIKANIYNIPVEQKNLFGKLFKAHITIDNLDCSMIDVSSASTLANYITEEVYNSSNNKINVANEAQGLYLHDSSLVGGANDGNYRYAGANPNNYVCFYGDDCTDENNLYRIISIDGTTNRIKLIKATSIGDKKWNAWPEGYDYSYDINIWEGSILETYLNGEYLTSLGDKSDLIDDTIWSIGGVDNTTYQNQNVKNFMAVELNNSTIYGAKIGLMYASDYGYAALPNNWINELYNYGKNLRGNDWLLTTSHLWTISRCSDDMLNVFYVYYTTEILDGNNKNNGDLISRDVSIIRAVHPSFNLKSSVKIINAGAKDVGSKTNPMIIA